MKNFKSVVALFLFATVIAVSCKKDTEETPAIVTPKNSTTGGSVFMNFANMVGDSTLIFHTKSYTTANNDTIIVDSLKYYISNIKLTNSDGSNYTEANSYHLINAAVASACNVTLSNVPFGKYTAISFMIGVDSARNVSGAQTGALDPGNDMFWSWSTGYIMAQLGGTSPQSTAAGKALNYNIIGFSGAYNVLKTVSPSFNNDTLRVTSGTPPGIHLKTDLSEWFKTPTVISIATTNTIILSGADAKTISDNYADMISVNYIHN